MGNTGTVLVSVIVLLLLLSCSACSVCRSSAPPDDPRLSVEPPELPVASNPPASSTPGGSVTAATYEAMYLDREPITQGPSHLRSRCFELKCKVRTDFQNYYAWLSMRDLLLGFAGGSVLANTSLDDDFQDWYQEDVRDSGTDSLASFWETFGEGQIFIPACACLAVVGATFDQTRLGSATGDFGFQATRAYLVGTPPLLFMQYCTGASRPGETSRASDWKPFDDSNGVSGHAFIGAVPFITAANMAEDPWLKGGLYFCSTLPAWARVNDDAHYLSQVCLGWWMAYLACNAVRKTEYEDKNLVFMPVTSPEMVGMGVVYQR